MGTVSPRDDHFTPQQDKPAESTKGKSDKERTSTDQKANEAFTIPPPPDEPPPLPAKITLSKTGLNVDFEAKMIKRNKEGAVAKSLEAIEKIEQETSEKRLQAVSEEYMQERVLDESHGEQAAHQKTEGKASHEHHESSKTPFKQVKQHVHSSEEEQDAHVTEQRPVNSKDKEVKDLEQASENHASETKKTRDELNEDLEAKKLRQAIDEKIIDNRKERAATE